MAEPARNDLDALLDNLAARDPQVRDERALGELADAIMSGALGAQQRAIVADRMVDHLRHKEIQARTFAPLVLAVLVEYGDWEQEWFGHVERWYLSEQDLRGHDPDLGWLHAVAHGADFFGAVATFGRRPAADILDVLARRLLVPTDAVWQDQEDARVAYAAALCLLRDPGATAWLDRVADALAAVEGPPPAWAANTISTLQALAIGLDQQILFNGEPFERQPDMSAARDKTLETVRSTQPWFWRTRTT